MDDDHIIDDVDELSDETLPAASTRPVDTETGLASSQGSIDDDETIDIDLALLDGLRRQPPQQPDTDATIIADRSLIATGHSDLGEVTPPASEPSRRHRVALWAVLGVTFVTGCAIAVVLYIAETSAPTTVVESESVLRWMCRRRRWLSRSLLLRDVPPTTVVESESVAEVDVPPTTVVESESVAEVDVPPTTVVESESVAEVDVPPTTTVSDLGVDDHGDFVE